MINVLLKKNIKYLTVNRLTLTLALCVSLSFSSCTENTSIAPVENQTQKTTFGITHQQKVQAFAHSVVYDFLMKIEFDADLVNRTSQEQLKSDLEKNAKDGLISREAFAAVLNQDLGIPLASTQTIFAFVEKNHSMISTITEKEFSNAMQEEFERLKNNPPKKATGIIGWLFEKAGWGNNPCTGKRIAYTLDVLIDTSVLVGTGGGAAVVGGVALAQDISDCIDAYTDCD